MCRLPSTDKRRILVLEPAAQNAFIRAHRFGIVALNICWANNYKLMSVAIRLFAFNQPATECKYEELYTYKYINLKLLWSDKIKLNYHKLNMNWKTSIVWSAIYSFGTKTIAKSWQVLFSICTWRKIRAIKTNKKQKTWKSSFSALR